MNGPLDGIRVVELGLAVAVPTATHILASQGADVVKVENADGGDDLRLVGSRKQGMSAWFANINAGKRSIGLDLQTPQGQAVLWKLIERADVFIQGFRPGAVDRLGFGATVVLERNPRLVYVSALGFGTTGPYADRPVYDAIIQSLAGWAGAQRSSEGPTLVRGMVADKVAALVSAQAVTAALVSRASTGRGQHVETSMLESNIAFLWPDVMMHCSLLDDDAVHLPNLLASIRLFECADGWVSLTAGTDAQWRACCAALGRPELGTDERFATSKARSENFTAWYASFASMLGPFSVSEALRRLGAAGVPAAPVLDPSEVATDQQVLARGAVREVVHPVAGRLRSPRPGATFAGDEPALAPAPMYGEHTNELLSELGYGPLAIQALREAGTVR